ncbi:hypothetical protein HYR69_03230 [Candidatus Sumerlaeota bacterium]|nr:hypothetical protein [Candidatus Sumerlaeota bacterium]MBI3736231.1 hypothetical protein [Candidatus Sumerlaeota bacterium]
MNPILEEIWRIKDQRAKKAGFDIHRMCELTRKWMEEHPHPGPVVRNAAELRQLAAEAERQRAEKTSFIVRESSPGED